MSYQKERDEFLVNAARWGIGVETARLLLRDAATIQRLATAECNGDYPCDNGERKVISCSRCEAGYVKHAMRRDHAAPKVADPITGRPCWIPLICPNCAAEDRVTKRLTPMGLKPHFQGDPRGYCVSIFKAETPFADIDCGRERGLVVPARG